jgi:sugar phosphate isomerase/epimerase
MQRLALTTWSIHPYLHEGTLALLDMPARIAQAGFHTVEICHFHISDTSPAYLAQLKANAHAAGVEIFSVLIDAYDISQADNASDIAHVKHWLDIASAIGASHARVIAGEAAPTDQVALQRAITALKEVQAYGTHRGVQVISENFKALASTPANWLVIHDALGYGGCADIGNFAPESRVADFAKVASNAASIHVKASYDAHGVILPNEVQACLSAARQHHFAGPTTIVYDRPGERWAGIETLRAIVAQAFA